MLSTNLPFILGEFASPSKGNSPVGSFSSFPGLTVLLVEDDASFRRMSCIALQRLRAEVIEAHDGAEAVSLFKRHQQRINLVLCDLNMPRMNGWETLKLIREMAPSIPFILNSGDFENPAMPAGLRERPSLLLEKPYQFRELKEAIAQVVAIGA